MTHVWLRAESRATEQRTPLMPEGAKALLRDGHGVTVERSASRIVPDSRYEEAGCEMAETGSWESAPADAVVLGLKELPESGEPLRGTHVFFAHAFKGQRQADALLDRFRQGGGTLLDLEYLVDDTGARVAAFGYHAGYVGAAVSLIAYGAQVAGRPVPPVAPWPNADVMRDAVTAALDGATPRTLVIGAKGRVGSGAVDLLREVGLDATLWDQEETASGGPFPEVARHDLMINAVLAMPGIPVFAGPELLDADRRLRVIGDVACDPGTPYNPVPLYDEPSSWENPVWRVHDTPPLDVMAIDNLPSLLPREASAAFAADLLPHLLALPDGEVWRRAEETFRQHLQ
ncbi:saccharopine dehydrogenase [Histidinibacterium aquaticum]|uniref:Saccharopine dehydrogenase [NAD(+), L-lysine-forming] n=1 Tax=Histidinibacterium aquaticum TaxID=2613962 RepID=A0A5J5GE17_9RHOB|nr:saccharopine dehydrogenase [Histidinibacterium aquaticum]KAA9006052.1 saccharopine dehydrogenase [Histidinibacterium aquaticum]